MQYKTSNWGVEGGYQSSKATYLAALGLQQVRQLERDAPVDQPVLRRQPARHDVPAAGQHVQQVHGDSQLPRPAVALGDLRALHVGGDHERRQSRRRARSNGTDVYAPTLPDAGHVQRRATSTSRSRWAGRRSRSTNVDTRVYYYWTKLDNKSDEITYGNAPHRCPAVSVAAISRPTGCRRTIVGNCENELYNYTKNNVGFDVWWRFTRGQRLGFGYDYLNLDQNRVDYDKSHYQQGVGRVQEHDARHAQRPAQVPVREARLDAELQ